MMQFHEEVCTRREVDFQVWELGRVGENVESSTFTFLMQPGIGKWLISDGSQDHSFESGTSDTHTAFACFNDPQRGFLVPIRSSYRM